MKIYLATDHAGFELKEKLKEFLTEQGYDVEDCGAFEMNSDDDYPDFIKIAAKKVSACEHGNPLTSSGQKQCVGIVFGGSGQGEAMVANRYKHVRAAVYYGGAPKIITLSREHNDANILSLGARFVTEGEAKKAVALWLKTPFTKKERHLRRIHKF